VIQAKLCFQNKNKSSSLNFELPSTDEQMEEIKLLQTNWRWLTQLKNVFEQVRRVGKSQIFYDQLIIINESDLNLFTTFFVKAGNFSSEVT